MRARDRRESPGFWFPLAGRGIDGMRKVDSPTDALKGTDFALLPIPGITAEGALFAPSAQSKIIPDTEMLSGMNNPGHIILGWADQNLKTHCGALGIVLHEYERDADLMLLRGPAIVEGVLKVLIENTQITIHRAHICLVGHGKIGALLTNTLLAIGAKVNVAARNPVQRAAAYAAGAEPYPLEALPEILPRMDIVIGSVPKQLINHDLLKTLRMQSLLVDVAAPPGTFDRDAAAKLGLRTVWARGMGSRAPVTVGRSQWTGIEKRIQAVLEERS